MQTSNSGIVLPPTAPRPIPSPVPRPTMNATRPMHPMSPMNRPNTPVMQQQTPTPYQVRINPLKIFLTSCPFYIFVR